MSFLFERIFPTHRLALLPDRWVLHPAGGALQVDAAFESAFDTTAPMQALEALLDKHAPSGRLRVTLSHHHVRLFLAPSPPAWLKHQEMRVWLDSALATALGDVGEKGSAWRLAWDLTPPGQAIVVAAIPEALLAGLHAVCQQRGIKLAGVRPWLAEAWQRRRRQLSRATGWYAVLEPGRQVLLRLQNGKPVALRQRQTSTDVALELDSLLARESLLADASAGGDLWLERAGISSDWGSLAGRYALHELAGPTEFAEALLQ
jgi:hypothetical protein